MINKFKLLVHESTAKKYEDLFVQIMTYTDDDFKSVKPYGNLGDRGNDGWNPKLGRYYQVYAPENLPKNTDKAIKKFSDDFKKLKSFWEDISEVKEYIFVVNDRFSGVSPHLTKAVFNLKKESKLSRAEIMTASDLEKLFSKLKIEHKRQILSVSSEKVNPWLLFNLYKNIYDAKCHFNMFKRIQLDYFIFNEANYNSTYNMLVRANFNYSNLNVGKGIISKDLGELIDEFENSSWEDKELKCLGLLSQISMEFSDNKHIIGLSSTYSELVFLSALDEDYSTQIINFKDSLSNVLGQEDEFITTSLTEVVINIKSAEEDTNESNNKILINLYDRLKFLISSTEMN